VRERRPGTRHAERVEKRPGSKRCWRAAYTGRKSFRGGDDYTTCVVSCLLYTHSACIHYLKMTTYIPSLTLPSTIFENAALSVLFPIVAGTAVGFSTQRKDRKTTIIHSS
jgi:hypothetical protein